MHLVVYGPEDDRSRDREHCERDTISFETVPQDHLVRVVVDNRRLRCYDIHTLYNWLVVKNSEPTSKWPFSQEQLHEITQMYSKATDRYAQCLGQIHSVSVDEHPVEDKEEDTISRRYASRQVALFFAWMGEYDQLSLDDRATLRSLSHARLEQIYLDFQTEHGCTLLHTEYLSQMSASPFQIHEIFDILTQSEHRHEHVLERVRTIILHHSRASLQYDLQLGISFVCRFSRVGLDMVQLWINANFQAIFSDFLTDAIIYPQHSYMSRVRTRHDMTARNAVARYLILLMLGLIEGHHRLGHFTQCTHVQYSEMMSALASSVVDMNDVKSA
jgi:hypothetical protein